MTYKIVIFDLDGVLLDERPYWEAAIRAALSGCVTDEIGLESFCGFAIDSCNLQRITKSRGCNSTWDLAAVLTECCTPAAGRDGNVAAAIRAGRFEEAAGRIELAASDLWARFGDGVARAAGDPLAGFGIDRASAGFAAVRSEFQRALLDDAPTTPRGDAGSITEVLRWFASAGTALAVCTGRLRAETVPAIEANGWAGFFPEAAIITSDDAYRAEQLFGGGRLGKPHWFTLVGAAVGAQNGLSFLSAGIDGAELPPALYVGDGLADFLPSSALRAAGHEIDFVLVRSGVTSAPDERRVRSDRVCRGVIDDVTELPALLEGERRGADTCRGVKA